jgi:hypothetical protein
VEVLELDFKAWPADPIGPEWVHLSSSGPAPPGDWHYLELAFDRARGVTVLFVKGETWEFDRTAKSWTHRTSDGPGARRGAALAYDEHRERVVLFGGRGESGLYDDTWEYDGVAWQLISPNGRPAARVEGKLAYDAGRRRMVLFGGGNTAGNPPNPFDAAAITWFYYTLGSQCVLDSECGSQHCTHNVCCETATCQFGRCDTTARPGECS